MKTIEIDNDIYEYIAKNTKEIGETASDILRRLLDLEAPTELKNTDSYKHELSEALSDLKFPRSRAMVDKFLYLLGIAHSQKQKEFQKVLLIQGRGRKYFTTSRQEIVDSGNSTQPKQIPSSSYWVMTNSPSSQKITMLREILILLNYSKEAISDAVLKLKT